MGTTENVQSWSTTAATNANADTAINWAEGQDAASVNNSARSMMAAVAKHVDDIGGALTASGTFNALTVTTNQGLSATQIAAGLRLLVKALSTNTTAAVTFAPDGLTAAPIKCADGSPLSIGSIQGGALLDLVYNAGTSEWWAMNIAKRGVTDGSNAAAGQIGEYVTQTFGSTGAIAANTIWNVGSMALSAGDWNVWGSVAFNISGGAAPNNLQGTVINSPSALGTGSGLLALVGPANWSSGTNMSIGIVRFNSSAAQTACLNVYASPISAGSVSATGALYARRVR